MIEFAPRLSQLPLLPHGEMTPRNEGIDFNKSQDRHLFGDIFEQLLRDLQNAGNAGEYYTPRVVTQFMVERTNPRLGELIFDPACGTGGFLTCTLEHIRKHEVKSPADKQRLQDSIRGVEKKPIPHLLCVTNMLLHGIEVPVNIRHDNTLAKPYASYTSSDRVDVIIASQTILHATRRLYNVLL
jgi:type I restriction enzyme M protein